VVIVAPRDLSDLGWHTGGDVRALAAGEAAPLLFRDLGPAATALLLGGALPRLAGPTSPVTYLRTAAYREPFVEHGHFGRVALLPAAGVTVWHAGVAEVYIADPELAVDPRAMELVPDDADLARLAREAAVMRDAGELREHLGGARHDAWKADTAGRLRGFAAELAAVERHLAPLRGDFQSLRQDRRDRARAIMAARGLTEVDLCAAWHHLAPARRAAVAAVVANLEVRA
jgi:hypothetical protein